MSDKPEPRFYEPGYQETDTCDVFRSDADERVWLCNVPLVDVAQGIQASTSLRRIKAYVERIAAYHLDYPGGRWTLIEHDHWRYSSTDGQP